MLFEIFNDNVRPLAIYTPTFTNQQIVPFSRVYRSKTLAHLAFNPSRLGQSDYFRTCIRSAKSGSPMRKVCWSRDAQIGWTAALDKNSSVWFNTQTFLSTATNRFLVTNIWFPVLLLSEKVIKTLQKVTIWYIKFYGVLMKMCLNYEHPLTINTHSVECMNAQHLASHIIYRLRLITIYFIGHKTVLVNFDNTQPGFVVCFSSHV